MVLKIDFKRIAIKNTFYHLYETPTLAMGYTELHFPMSLFKHIFPGSTLRELEQIHSAAIFPSHLIETGDQGDGIIVHRPGELAIIETADCTPLFFWSDKFPMGGVVHVGWQGLLLGIENKLVALLKENDPHIPLDSFFFYLGPAIEKKCYEVGTELLEKFSAKSFASQIFAPHPQKKGKYLMDISSGIRLSLKENGIDNNRIEESPYCTYCESAHFPSYRRAPGTGLRINNFFFLKDNAG